MWSANKQAFARWGHSEKRAMWSQPFRNFQANRRLVCTGGCRELCTFHGGGVVGCVALPVICGASGKASLWTGGTSWGNPHWTFM